MTYVPAYTATDELDRFGAYPRQFAEVQSHIPVFAVDQPTVEIQMKEQSTVNKIQIKLIGNFGQPESWIWEVSESLNAILALEENWDSYGAKRVPPKTIVATLQLLFNIMDKNSPSASIVPTPKGNVQVEWHCNDIDLEIEVTADGTYSFFYEDHTNSDEFYEDNSFQHTIDNPSQLIQFVENITQRAEKENRRHK